MLVNLGGWADWYTFVSTQDSAIRHYRMPRPPANMTRRAGLADSGGARSVATTPNRQETNEMAFYELRQYKVRPGKMDEWVKIMEE